MQTIFELQDSIEEARRELVGLVEGPLHKSHLVEFDGNGLRIYVGPECLVIRPWKAARYWPQTAATIAEHTVTGCNEPARAVPVREAIEAYIREYEEQLISAQRVCRA